jgi:BCD family chlorophyll transporter-like MFS transporter
MQMAAPEQTGLALGAWGAVQATACGLAMAAGGLLRQLLDGPLSTGAAYASVYGLEAIMLVLTLLAMAPLVRNRVPAPDLPLPDNRA